MSRIPNLSVYNFLCTAKPGDKQYAEVHGTHSLSYVRRGSFGCRTLGKQHELIAGAVMVGRPGQEYMATHEHHECGDECLSEKLSPELAESLNAGKPAWDLAQLPPRRRRLPQGVPPRRARQSQRITTHRARRLSSAGVIRRGGACVVAAWQPPRH